MLWDTAGQEEFDAITRAYYRGQQFGVTYMYSKLYGITSGLVFTVLGLHRVKCIIRYYLHFDDAAQYFSICV